MKDNVQARLDFVQNVMNGNYTRAEAEAALERMERTYGDSAFLPGTVTRKPHPWTEKDLEDLEMEFIAGAGSREFLSYMAEMGEEVHQNVRQKKREKKQTKTVGIIAAVLAVVAIVALIVHALRG